MNRWCAHVGHLNLPIDTSMRFAPWHHVRKVPGSPLLTFHHRHGITCERVSGSPLLIFIVIVQWESLGTRLTKVDVINTSQWSQA